MTYIIKSNNNYLSKMSILKKILYSVHFDWINLFIRDANRCTVDT